MEFLEVRTTPAGFADPFAATFSVIDAPADRVNVVSTAGAENPVTLARIAAAPFAAEVRHVGFGIYNVTLAAGTDPTAAVTYFGELPGVTAAEPDYTIQAKLTPNDPQFSSLWAMPKISVPTAWDTTTGSGNFVVAVIDTGVDYNHPDLAANMWHNPADAIDGIDNDGNGIIDDFYGSDFANNDGNPMDDNGHGTHVAGTIGAIGNNALGVVGVNWYVKIMALKFLSANGSGSTSGAIAALNYAVAHGAKVSNNSWGGGGYSTALFNAIQAAQNAGHIFVAAAGNNSGNIDGVPFYPASYNLANVVAVASTGSTDAKSGFSNYGANTVDIAAPGEGIRSTWPGGGYATLSGTSMAAPHVAGAIALYWDANPTATATQVIDRLKATGDVVPGLTGSVQGGRRLNVGAMLAGSTPPVDTGGPRVTAAAFSGTSPNNLSSVRFTFSEAIDPASFTAGDVSLTGPNGPIAVGSVAVVNPSTNTQFDVTFPAQTAAGTYTVVIGPDITDTVGNRMNQDGDATNGEVPDDRFTATRALTPPATFDAGGLPLSIRDFQSTQATITVDRDIPISDVNVRFSLTHTWDSDLVIRLVGPSGSSVTLVNRRGGSGDNFTNTTLDDEAGVPIASGAAPFAGTYRPETPLSVFDTLNARGTWTLEVYDAAYIDIGTLTAFRLVITGANGGSSLTVLGFREGDPFTEPVGGAAPVSPTTPGGTDTPVVFVRVPPADQPADSPVNLLLAPAATVFSFPPSEPRSVRAVLPPDPTEDVVAPRAAPVIVGTPLTLRPVIANTEPWEDPIG